MSQYRGSPERRGASDIWQILLCFHLELGFISLYCKNQIKNPCGITAQVGLWAPSPVCVSGWACKKGSFAAGQFLKAVTRWSCSAARPAAGCEGWRGAIKQNKSGQRAPPIRTVGRQAHLLHSGRECWHFAPRTVHRSAQTQADVQTRSHTHPEADPAPAGAWPRTLWQLWIKLHYTAA